MKQGKVVPQRQLDLSCDSDLEDYDSQFEISDSVKFYWSIDESSEILSAQLVYEGEGYLAWGVSPDGEMVGSLAVIGLPGDGVAEYDLTSKSESGVVSRLESETSLVSGEVTQSGGITTLTFERQLAAASYGDIAINPDESQFFIWAYGGSNELVRHTGRGSFELTLNDCATAKSVSESGLSDAQIHGLLMAIGWVILIPIGMAIGRFTKSSKYFIYLHGSVQMAAAILIIAGFIMALTLSETEDNHFHDVHGKVGLAIVIAMLVHILIAILRPKKVEFNASTVAEAASGGSRIPLPVRYYLRKVWEYLHRIVAILLIILAYFNVFEGINLPEADLSDGYRIALSIIIAVTWVSFGVIGWAKRKPDRKTEIPNVAIPGTN